MTIRPVDLIREEIGDLADYLRNLPLSLRDSPYGQVYQQRLTALTDELSQVELDDWDKPIPEGVDPYNLTGRDPTQSVWKNGKRPSPDYYEIINGKMND